MSRRSHVPKFGNWDSNDHVPFTAVFDSARQGRRVGNPNDPSENVLDVGGRPGAPPKRYNINDPEDSEAYEVHQQARQPHGGQQQQRSRQQQRAPNNASQAQSGPGNGVASQQRAGAGHYRRSSRENVNELTSTSNHPSGDNLATQGSTGRGSARTGMASPAWEARRKSSAGGDEGHMFAPATPNKSRLRPGGYSASNEPAGKGTAAVPRFGAWDAQDPGSGDGFTVIFNNARQEKIVGGPVNTLPGTPENSKASDAYANSANSGYSKGKHHKTNRCCSIM